MPPPDAGDRRPVVDALRTDCRAPYRPEIDGLRAVAVLAVILFHAGLGPLAGGFAGVDVFFVISGFLITGILLDDLRRGSFSLRRFYDRRARRILPALIFVAACVTPFALAQMTPAQLDDYGQSLAAVALFASNFHFWAKEDYFAPSAEILPMLHTWSLAVEEQYYLVFPLLLAALWRAGYRAAATGVALVLAASLALWLWATAEAPGAGFYLAPFRVWELLAGSLAAMLVWRAAPAPNGAVALVGMAMICAGLVAADAATAFRGASALLAVGGTVLVLVFARGGTAVGKALSARPVVGLGLISYSAYLWHQPLFAFARMRAGRGSDGGPGGEPPPALMLGLVIATLALAWLTWRHVEQPFRNRTRPVPPTRRRLFQLGAAASLGLLALGLVFDFTDGLPGRLSPEAREVLAYETYDRAALYREGQCFLRPGQTGGDFAQDCFDGAPAVLVGDSYAAALASGLRARLGAGQLTASGCPPFAGYRSVDRPNCEEIFEAILGRIAAERPAQILLHAHWSRYPVADIKAGLIAAVASLRRVTDAEIVVIGGVPRWTPSLPEALLRRGQVLRASQSTPADIAAVAAADALLEDAAAAAGVVFVPLLDALCDGGDCRSVVPWRAGFAPLAWDYGHLTEAGASVVAALVAAAIASPPPPG